MGRREMQAAAEAALMLFTATSASASCDNRVSTICVSA